MHDYTALFLPSLASGTSGWQRRPKGSTYGHKHDSNETYYAPYIPNRSKEAAVPIF